MNLKRNILKMASQDPSFRKILIQKLGNRERRPGEVWGIPGVRKKFRAMNKHGLVFSFMTKEEAFNYAHSQEDPDKIKEWNQIVDAATDAEGITDWEEIDDGGSRDGFEEDWGPMAR